MRRAVNAAFFRRFTVCRGGCQKSGIGHDGNWSVLIITEKGDCDRAYRYPLAVADGQVRYAGESGANVSGTVAAGGAVKVSIRMGDKGANGTGHLSGSAGAGTWRGSGGGASCAGRWEAEKR
jgi:hypothetical protein